MPLRHYLQLSLTPGLGPITVNARAMEMVKARKTKPHTWYFDFQLLFQYWGDTGATKKRAFHHTAPVSSIYGIHEALRLIAEEGLETRWARHQQGHETLVRGLEKLGLQLFTPAANRAPTINVISVPNGVDEAKVRARLLDWRALPDDLPRHDLVVASDVLYEKPYAQLVADVLARTVAPAGRAIVADPGRLAAPDFALAARRAGFAIDESDVRRIDVGGITQRIRLYALRWA